MTVLTNALKQGSMYRHHIACERHGADVVWERIMIFLTFINYLDLGFSRVIILPPHPTAITPAMVSHTSLFEGDPEKI